ncbi:MAG: nitrilase [Deltaproteobacteria bacterium]|nr:MAG: nitrilase [Deltaproteobacteria bacterium]
MEGQGSIGVEDSELSRVRDIKVAMVCMHSEIGEVAGNLAKVESYTSQASDKGVEIICFPELSLSGYTLSNPQKAYVGLRTEEVVETIVQTAKQKGIIVIAGLIEPSTKRKPYISQIVAGPQGLLGLYRKTHLSPLEKGVYLEGEKIQIFSSNAVSFGIQLCYESHFPEISTVMALKGAEIIFLPHASPRGSPEEKLESWRRHLPSRAFDNSVFVLACNQVGETSEGFSFPGVALALAPTGEMVESYCGKDEQMITVSLQREKLEEVRKHKMKYFLRHRRPRLYAEIASPVSRLNREL